MTKLLQTARVLLMRGEPLPCDLTARLLALGVDVSRLEQNHGA